MASMRLAFLTTHPIQYHAPVYRRLQEAFGIPVTAIYGSDHSVKGYRDEELPTATTIATKLNQLGYYPTTVAKSKPKKS